MMNKLTVVFFALFSFSCGTTELVYIESIVPYSGAASSSGDIVVNASVDTMADYCIDGLKDPSDATYCTLQSVGAHYAQIKFVNNADGDNDNPDYGRLKLNKYLIEFTAHENGPALGAYEGAINLSIPPNSQSSEGEAQGGVSYEAILLDFYTKDYFNQQVVAVDYTGPQVPMRYSAKYTFSGASDLEIKGSVDFLLGNFDNCPEGTTYTSACPE